MTSKASDITVHFNKLDDEKLRLVFDFRSSLFSLDDYECERILLDYFIDALPVVRKAFFDHQKVKHRIPEYNSEVAH